MVHEIQSRVLGAVAALLVCAAGCQHGGEMPEAEDPRVHATAEPTAEAMAAADPMEAEADLEAAEGERIDGEVELRATAEGVRLVAEVENAPPGRHGFHIHEKGDCSAIAKKSMGGHFNPESNVHALPQEAVPRHLGDLGNLDVGADGKGYFEFTVVKANLKNHDAMSLLGKAVVVHRGPDTGELSQPSGDSGTPIACGVIEADD